ncbi:MAG: DUF2235 domain-containing protein [Pseudonocardiaceae bacterium]
MSKRLVVCCDGTWNKPDQIKKGLPVPTNVPKLARAVAPSDRQGREQRMFYQPGVGTKRWERFRGGAFGAKLGRNVLDAYRFVVQNYEPGDEIFFFGFSRGAFTARSTAGLIRNSGILRPEHADLTGQAYALYRDRDPHRNHPDSLEAELFRRSYSYPKELADKPVRFIGVWDTVGTLGIPLSGLRLINWFNRRWQFHDAQLSSEVGAAFQALAIDEKRGPFQPSVWKQSKKAEGQRLEQVWFAGVHKDVGGGYSDSTLAEIALLWMVDRAKKFGLAFEPDAFAGLPSGCECAVLQRYTGAYVAPGPFVDLHNSSTGIYPLLAGIYRLSTVLKMSKMKMFEGLDGERTPGKPDKRQEPGSTDKRNEYVASTVVGRKEHRPDYRPTNILTNADNTLEEKLVPTQASTGAAGTKPERPHWLTGPCPSTCPWNRAAHGSGMAGSGMVGSVGAG